MLGKAFSTLLLFASFGMAQSPPSKPFIALCCSLPATVSVLDTTTLEVVNQFPSALGAAMIAPAPDFASFYVLTQAHEDGPFSGGPPGSVNSVVILHSDGKPSGNIPIATMPFGIIFDPAEGTAYVAAADESFQSHLYTIDTASETLTGDSLIPGQSFGPNLNMVMSADGKTIYVRTFEGGAIEAINTNTRKVVGQYTCTVPYSYCSGLALAAGGNLLTLVFNSDQSKAVLYLDSLTLNLENALLTPLSHQMPGNAIAVSPDGNTAYLSSLDDDYQAGDLATLDVPSATFTNIQAHGWDDKFAVVSPSGNSLLTNPQPERLHVQSLSDSANERSTGVLGDIGSVFFNATGDRLYVLNLASAEVAVLDPVTGEVDAYIPSGPQPVSIASGRERLFTANRRSQTLSVIDPITMAVVKNVPVPFQGQYLTDVATSAGNVFVADSEDLQELNLATGVFRALELPPSGCYTLLRGMTPTPDGKQLFVAFVEGFPVSGCGPDEPRPNETNQIKQGVRVYNPATGNVLKDIPVSGAEQVVFTADSASAYVGGFTQSGLHQITEIDTQTLHISRIFQLPSVQAINAVALNGSGSTLYILDLTSFQIASVETASGTAVQSTPVDHGTTWMAGNPEGSQLYLGSDATPLLQVFDTASNAIVHNWVLKSPSRAAAFYK